ncbi:MAG: ABC transporter permease [Candidatus Tectomicrobia bacterium]|uniref:ABC transporter permease n=1 Tax=Tectimicrobiota bacterium TaxID=2528274 RepID=A0A932MP24_UNCTE|nr:ABC transporter permease [Candidatus Tectomicrobia bacterium]
MVRQEALALPDEESAPAFSARMGLARSLRRYKTAFLGLIFLGVLLLMALTAPLIAPHDPHKIDVAKRLWPAYWTPGGIRAHPLGTDSLGRDILSRLIYGARVSIMVGVVSVAISGVVGITLGLVAGFFGGKLDDFIMGLAEIQLAFPFILLAITVMAVVGPGLFNVITVLGISRWVAYGRVVRGQVLTVREKEFVEAARALGYPLHRVLFFQILPNITSPLIVIATFAVAGNIISESSLSFLGLGVPTSTVTWGSMLAEGREYLRVAWWLAAFPGLAIMLTVLSINLIGDWLRDYFDPRLRDQP